MTKNFAKMKQMAASVQNYQDLFINDVITGLLNNYQPNIINCHQLDYPQKHHFTTRKINFLCSCRKLSIRNYMVHQSFGFIKLAGIGW